MFWGVAVGVVPGGDTACVLVARRGDRLRVRPGGDRVRLYRFRGRRWTPNVLAVESTVAAIFVIIAAAAVTGSPWLLVVGLAGHGLKDLWQHRRQFVANTRWWPPFCARGRLDSGDDHRRRNRRRRALPPLTREGQTLDQPPEHREPRLPPHSDSGRARAPGPFRRRRDRRRARPASRSAISSRAGPAVRDPRGRRLRRRRVARAAGTRSSCSRRAATTRFPGSPSPATPTATRRATRSIAYLEQYAAHLRAPDRASTAGPLADARGRRASCSRLDGRQIVADQVVVATGPFQVPFVPALAERSSRRRSSRRTAPATADRRRPAGHGPRRRRRQHRLPDREGAVGDPRGPSRDRLAADAAAAEAPRPRPLLVADEARAARARRSTRGSGDGCASRDTLIGSSPRELKRARRRRCSRAPSAPRDARSASPTAASSRSTP